VRSGSWLVTLDAMEADSQGQSLSVSAAETLRFDDVVVGDVWLCSGQSNMTGQLVRTIAHSARLGDRSLHRAWKNGLPRSIRHFGGEPRNSALEPAADLVGSWELPTAEAIKALKGWSGVCYFFADRVHREVGVPMGLVTAAAGNSALEAWVSRETLEASPAMEPVYAEWREYVRNAPPVEEVRARLKQERAEWLAERDSARAEGLPDPPRKVRELHPLDSFWYPSTFYNGMIVPISDLSIKGVVWYQGESNIARAYQYRELLPLLFADWRRAFGQPRLPFYVVQIPDLKLEGPTQPTESSVAELRESQLLVTQADEAAELAVTIDSHHGGIHPPNKFLPGQRLAAAALAKTYGRAGEYAGPSYRSMEIQDGRAILSFDHVDTGLISAQRLKPGTQIRETREELTLLSIAGADRRWHRARARIEGDRLIVWSEAVSEPAAVRYAWVDEPKTQVLLYNRAGFPASSFRTDSWPISTQNSQAPLRRTGKVPF
jgi:sialate O-acetylesterase